MSKIGLVLSGGGTRGLAHIGVLKVAEDLGIKFDYIAGCSIGAIIGVCYAAGKKPAEIEDFVLQHKTYKLFKFSLSRLGLGDSAKLEAAVYDFIKVKNFKQLSIPVFINSTNLSQGKEVVFDRGDIYTALRASLAVPGIFTPAKIKNDRYIDGGVLNQTPHSILPADTTHYLLVNASPFEKMGHPQKLTLVDILAASIKVMQNEITYLKMAFIPRDRLVLIEPDLTSRSLLQSEKHFKDIIKIGEAAAIAQIQEMRDKLLLL